MSEKNEKGKWSAVATLKKYKGNYKSGKDAERKGAKPYEVLTEKGNLLVTVGIAILLDKLIGAGTATVYSNANARLGVGTGQTAAAAGDVDLQTAGVWVAMDATYPSRSGSILTFQSTFGTGTANQAWNEWAIDNGAAAHVLLNHKAPVTLGTKTSGETWVLTVTVTQS